MRCEVHDRLIAIPIHNIDAARRSLSVELAANVANNHCLADATFRSVISTTINLHIVIYYNMLTFTPIHNNINNNNDLLLAPLGSY